MKTMSMFVTKEDMLNSILSTMDIPDNRRDITDGGNVTWLLRNLQFKNRNNEDYGTAISILKEIYKENKNEKRS